jgi:hypothetical protein
MCFLLLLLPLALPMPRLPGELPTPQQTMIMNFLGFFFKVQPLTWQEWLFTIAIGAGAMIWSTIVRFASRNISCGEVSLFTAIGNRLARMNQVTSKQMAASHAVYDGPGSLEMTVHDAVTLARGKAAAAESAAAAEADKEAEGKKGSGWLKGKRNAKHYERTLSGRSDSAASLN